MKLINLNLQDGIIYEPLMEFVKKQSSDVDIFCFQEVFNNPPRIRPILKGARPNLFSELQNTLTDFNGYYAASLEDDVGGLAIFIKKSFVVNNTDNRVLFSELNTTEDETDPNYFAMGRNLQVLEFSNAGKVYTVFNFHGMWVFKNKSDTEKRILQSEKLREIFDKANGSKILCTDLNVLPGTKTLDILKEGNRDIIEEYKIISTRSLLKNRPEVVDYVMVSPEVEVKDFKVLPEEVSDHLPLYLEFN